MARRGFTASLRPVTWHGSGGGGFSPPWHAMSACEREITNSPVRTGTSSEPSPSSGASCTRSALTVIEPGVTTCSLIVTFATPSRLTTWFGAPVTATSSTGWPAAAIGSATICDLPLSSGPYWQRQRPECGHRATLPPLRSCLWSSG